MNMRLTIVSAVTLLGMACTPDLFASDKHRKHKHKDKQGVIKVKPDSKKYQELLAAAQKWVVETEPAEDATKRSLTSAIAEIKKKNRKIADPLSKFDIDNPNEYTVLHAAVSRGRTKLIAEILDYMFTRSNELVREIKNAEGQTAYDVADRDFLPRFQQIVQQRAQAASDAAAFEDVEVSTSSATSSTAQVSADEGHDTGDDAGEEDATVTQDDAAADSAGIIQDESEPVTEQEAQEEPAAQPVEVAQDDELPGLEPVAPQADAQPAQEPEAVVEEDLSDEESYEWEDEEAQESDDEANQTGDHPGGAELGGGIPSQSQGVSAGPANNQQAPQASKNNPSSIKSFFKKYKWHTASVIGVAGLAGWYYWNYVYKPATVKPTGKK